VHSDFSTEITIKYYGETTYGRVRLFTFLPLKAPRNGGLPETRWSADVLTGYSQPRTPEEYKAFLMAAFEPEDVFDFSNPSDVAEFERLYRRPCRKGPRACE
jgi:hypothetical protein